MSKYYRYFGLERDPFLDTADPYFYCELGVLRQAKERLASSIESSRGLTVILGEPGTGKTSLSGALEQEMLQDDRIVLGKILDPSFATETEFLIAIGRVFGLSLPPRSTHLTSRNLHFGAVRPACAEYSVHRRQSESPRSLH